MSRRPAALEAAIAFRFRNQSVPYTDADVEALDQLQYFAGGEVPYGLEHVPNLVSLTFRGCGAIDLRRDLGFRPKVRRLTCWQCMLTDVSEIAQLLPGLDALDVGINQVRDIRALLELPKLRMVRLAGNPLDEESFRVVYPELKRRGKVNLNGANGERGLVDERDWELMQLFVARGLKLSAYRVNGKTNVAAPGHTVYRSPEGMGRDVGPSQVRRILDENPGIDEAGFLALADAVDRAEGYRE